MEIIKQGMVPEETIVLTGTCRRCGCVVRGLQKEWTRQDRHNLQGGLAFEFPCPTPKCGWTIVGYKTQ